MKIAKNYKDSVSVKFQPTSNNQFLELEINRFLLITITSTIKNHKMKNGIYISSLILIGISIFLLVEYPNSGKMSLIAGAITFIGFALNIAGYVLNKKL